VGENRFWVFQETVSVLLVHWRLTWEQNIGKTECTEISNAHGVENALQVIALMLHDTGMEPVHGTVYGPTVLIRALIAQSGKTWHHAA
jgi:hypothetical protein